MSEQNRELVPIDHAVVVGSPSPAGEESGRDVKGRFIAGAKGNGGSRKGIRNKLSHNYVSALAEDFARDGAIAIVRCREERPDVYLKLIGQLVPRELKVETEEHGISIGTIERAARLARVIGSAAIEDTSKAIDLD